MDLVRRQDGAMARCDDARADAHVALRHGCVRRRTLLQDSGRPGHLPLARPHRPPVPVGADFRNEDPVRQGGARRGAEGMRAAEQSRLLLPAAARVLRLARDGRRRQVESCPGRDCRVALGCLPRRRRARKGYPRQDVVVHASSSEHHDVRCQGGMQLRSLDPRQPGSDARRL